MSIPIKPCEQPRILLKLPTIPRACFVVVRGLPGSLHQIRQWIFKSYHT